MKWQDVHSGFPHQWVLMEALETHSQDGYWRVDEVSVVCSCGQEGNTVWKLQEAYKSRFPNRNFFFYHTANEEIQIQEINGLTFARVWQSDLVTVQVHLGEKYATLPQVLLDTGSARPSSK